MSASQSWSQLIRLVLIKANVDKIQETFSGCSPEAAGNAGQVHPPREGQQDRREVPGAVPGHDQAAGGGAGPDPDVHHEAGQREGRPEGRHHQADREAEHRQHGPGGGGGQHRQAAGEGQDP